MMVNLDNAKEKETKPDEPTGNFGLRMDQYSKKNAALKVIYYLLKLNFKSY